MSFKFDQSPNSTHTVTIARQLKLSLTRGCLGCIIHFISLNISLTTKDKLEFEISIVFNVNINADSPLVVAIAAVFQILAAPNSKISIPLQVKWRAEVSED